ncbi:hypothetical protein Tco_1450150 [Tanacetum coccineum]
MRELRNVSLILIVQWMRAVMFKVLYLRHVLMEERFLRQKAKVDWLRDGDANSAYFYKLVKNRVTRSRIDIVTDLEGVISPENEKVGG